MIIEGRITLLSTRVRGLHRSLIIDMETTDNPPRLYRTIPPVELLPDLIKILAVGIAIRVDGVVSQVEGEDFSDIEMVKLTRLATGVIPWASIAPQLGVNRY